MYEHLKSQRVSTQVVEFTTNRPKAGRRGSPRIPKGTILYAIKYLNRSGGYFTYSYENKQDAIDCIQRQKEDQTDNEFYYPWNVTYDIQDTLHVGHKAKV